MKIYISAKWQLKEKVKEIQEYLTSQRHEIISKWVERAFTRDYEEFNDSGKFAEEETQAILRSDVFIHISDEGGKGKYVDLGIAIAGNKLNKKPKIFVMGKGTNESQFYFHQSVERIKTKNYLDGLKQILTKL